MPKFLFKIRYSQEGLKGTLAEGFANREAYIRDLTSNMGLSIEAFYWALGEDDVFIIFDGPSANAIAASLVASAGGIGKISTVALLTAAEMDEAASKLPDYRAPGG
jgi:uncharacterized protein with GYD domain